MKLGMRSNTYYFPGTKKVDYARMKKHGYDCADFQALTGGEGSFLNLPEEEMIEALKLERKAAEENGIEFSQVHGVWPTDDTTAEKRAETMERMKKAVRGTAVLDGKYLVVHPQMPYGWGPEADADEAERINEEFFRELCAYAEGYNVGICIENMPMKEHRLSRTCNMIAFVRRLNLPNLTMCLDTGHCNVYKDDCGEMVRLIGDKLTTLHVHDNTSRADEHLWPYSGSIDWQSFKQALFDIGFEGCMSIEADVSKNYPASIREDMEIAIAKITKSLTEI